MKNLLVFFLAAFIWSCPLISKGQDLTFVNHSELGLLTGSDNSGPRNNFTFQTFNGFQLTRRHAVGFVTGLDQYANYSVLPLALGWRGVLNPKNKWQMYGAGELGYGSAVFEREEVNEWGQHNWRKGGVMGQVTIGFRYKTKKANFWTLSVSLKRQFSYFYTGNPSRLSPNRNRPEDWNYFEVDKVTFNNLVYRIGYWF
ncbi:hypothetical protein [Cyclobacterium amurskyense]|uniref:Uncharacterized protein n=1 Tax=Cyclobacterium amurskyense TaxID=320787 RepID=A0A0H4PE79_9BACT|nr:hypothetical protein [Cyclobacterium amurskyense]AKP52554.1 hypothetical protein CA2015_3156 [Cyclobacterium amurskyense]